MLTFTGRPCCCLGASGCSCHRDAGGSDTAPSLHSNRCLTSSIGADDVDIHVVVVVDDNDILDR
jgi:hypothetical protein